MQISTLAVILVWLGMAELTAAPSFTLTAWRLPDHTLHTSMRVNGAGPFSCIFDTGGSRTISLDTGAATRAGLQPTGEGQSAGSGPTIVTDQRIFGAMVTLGELSLPNHTVVLRPKGEGVPSDCVFGTGVLQAFVVQLDYGTPEIRLYDAAGFRPGPDMTNVPVTYWNGDPIIPVRFELKPGSTFDAKFVVDTALRRWPLALRREFSDENDILHKTDKVVTPPFKAESIGTIPLLATRTTALSVGSFTTKNDIAMLFRSNSAVALPWDGAIGSEFFRRFTVTLDYPGNRFFLAPGAELRQAAAPYDASGILVRGSPGKFRIENVLPDSPGDAAGLKTGDAIVSMDGTPSAQLDIYQIREKLCRSTAGKCAIRVRRGDSELSVTVELKPAF